MSTASRNRNRRCAKLAAACPAALMCCIRKAKGWKLASASTVAVSSVLPAPGCGSAAPLAGRRWNCSDCLPAPESPKPHQRRFPARWRVLAALGYLTVRNARIVVPASSCQACRPLRWLCVALWALPVGSLPLAKPLCGLSGRAVGEALDCPAPTYRPWLSPCWPWVFHRRYPANYQEKYITSIDRATVSSPLEGQKGYRFIPLGATVSSLITLRTHRLLHTSNGQRVRVSPSRALRWLRQQINAAVRLWLWLYRVPPRPNVSHGW